MMHMLACLFLSAFVIHVLKLVPAVEVNSADRFRRIAPFAAVFIVNIVLGNYSLDYVPVSFMQTIKSSVPAFTYLLQNLLGYKKFDFETGGALVPVVTGVMLATWTEVNFNWPGFLCALIASVTTAIQSIVSGVLLSGSLKMDPINLVYQLSPFAIAFLIPFIYMWEQEEIAAFDALFEPQFLSLLIISSVIAFTLNFSVFFAIKHTSALAFTVAGNLKVVFVIVISVAIFRNEITFVNGIGIVVTVVGCWIYSVVQERQKLLIAAGQKNGQ